MNKNNCLQNVNPELAKKWHPTRNGFLTPRDVTHGSGKKVWWICSKGHEWKASVTDRNRGRGCPYCSGRAASENNCLKTVNPELAKEWHPTKNGDLTPRDVTTGSGKKVWWICSKGHEWKALISNRNYGNGCPYCAGKAVSEDNCLQTVNPELAKEWHPTKNGSLTPWNVTHGSGKKVWWVCRNEHEWETSVSNRSHGNGCPYCAGRKVSEDNCLQILNPELAKEWHPTKNGDLTPRDVTSGSEKKVWWICSKGHEWEAIINSRCNGNGCPYCSGKAVSEDNCLQTVNPELVKEWHPTKNGSLTPRDVTHGSSKKVWWICAKGHEWENTVSNRSYGRGCPYCSGRSVNRDNCLQAMNPDLAKEWHSTKNGNLTAQDVLPSAAKKVWWICAKGHEWEATVNSRCNGNGCPYCSGKAANEDNCLQTINPELAKEWHLTQNGSLTPRDVTPGSGKKVWWICSKGHEWEALINNRNKGSECPFCNSQTSQLELRIYTEMKYLFSHVQHRAKIKGVECDIYIPSLNVGIEIDGMHWHKNKYDKDKEKADFLKKHDVTLIRIREKGLELTSKNDIFFSTKEPDFKILSRVINKIMQITNVQENVKSEIKEYLREEKIKNDDAYLNLLNILPSPLPGCSLEERNIQLTKEWHPTKNASLTPRDVSPGSRKKVWWFCNKAHEWKAAIADRNYGYGCPYCTGQAASEDNCLQNVNFKLAKEWHPTKNGSLTPRDVTPGSGKKVWWICSKGHEWEATINLRNRVSGCPYCAGQAVSADNCLGAVKPLLAEEWHPTKNGSLTPRDVTPGSGKKVWWICNVGHEWETRVNDRSKGRRCPYCVGRAVNKDNCLQTVNPKLAKEWHPTKNGSLTPWNVTHGSGKKVWWLCNKRHEWETSVLNRSYGRGCPFCVKKVKIKELR